MIVRQKVVRIHLQLFYFIIYDIIVYFLWLTLVSHHVIPNLYDFLGRQRVKLYVKVAASFKMM